MIDARDVVDTIDQPVFSVGPAGEITFLNDAFLSWTGLDREAVAGSDYTAVAAPFDDGFDELRGAIDAVASTDDGGERVGLTITRPDAPSVPRHAEARVTPVVDDGEADGVVVVLRDVTERTERERALARYKRIFESVTDRVYVLDEDDRFVVVNDQFAELLGHDPEDLIGRPFASVLAPDAELPPVSSESAGRATELLVETAGGDRFPCETHRAPITFGFQDRSGGSVGVMRDISQRKAMESDLAETTERYETLIEASPLAIVALDADGLVERWNAAAETTFGWSKSAVRGRRVPFVPEESGAFWDAHERVVAGERVTDLEVTLTRESGERSDASASIAPIIDDDGVYGSVAVIADITDRKERERELRRKNERLDSFASIVSHDLRNPISVAQGYLDLGRETDDEAHFDEVENALERMERMVDELLVLARQGYVVGEAEPVDFGDVARHAWDGVDTGDATLRVVSTGTVEADEGRLMELLGNLFRNSVEHGSTSPRSQAPEDAVEHGTTTDRTTGTGEADGAAEDGPTVTTGTTPEGFFVADDGPGIPEAERENVLETGYTTEADGTGFGLGIVDEIAEAHGWSVSVGESETGGARIDVTFDTE